MSDATSTAAEGSMEPPKPKYNFVEPQKLVKSPMDMVAFRIHCDFKINNIE